MSKKSKKNKNKYEYDERFENYFVGYEEGEYIAKSVYSRGVKRIYIYSTAADVTILPENTTEISSTLHGELYGEQFHFDVFRLENTVYIYATCDVERISPIRLLVTLPNTEEYKIEVVTNLASITVKKELVAKKLELKAGKRLQKQG